MSLPAPAFRPKSGKPPGTVTLTALDEPTTWLPSRGDWLTSPRTGYEVVEVHVVKTREPMPGGRQQLTNAAGRKLPSEQWPQDLVVRQYPASASAEGGEACRSGAESPAAIEAPPQEGEWLESGHSDIASAQAPDPVSLPACRLRGKSEPAPCTVPEPGAGVDDVAAAERMAIAEMPVADSSSEPNQGVAGAWNMPEGGSGDYQGGAPATLIPPEEGDAQSEGNEPETSAQLGVEGDFLSSSSCGVVESRHEVERHVTGQRCMPDGSAGRTLGEVGRQTCIAPATSACGSSLVERQDPATDAAGNKRPEPLQILSLAGLATGPQEATQVGRAGAPAVEVVRIASAPSDTAEEPQGTRIIPPIEGDTEVTAAAQADNAQHGEHEASGPEKMSVAGRLKAMGVVSGVADLHLTLGPSGRTAWIEMKAPEVRDAAGKRIQKGGKQFGAQEQFQAAEISRGALYAVCDSLEQVIATIAKWTGRPTLPAGLMPAPKSPLPANTEREPHEYLQAGE
jgi:hypothetical protein